MNRSTKIFRVLLWLILPIIALVFAVLKFLGHFLADSINSYVIVNFVSQICVCGIFLGEFFLGGYNIKLIEENKKLKDEILSMYEARGEALVYLDKILDDLKKNNNGR